MIPKHILDYLCGIFDIIKSVNKPKTEDMVTICGNHIIVISGSGKMSCLDLSSDTGINISFIYGELVNYIKTGECVFTNCSAYYYKAIDLYNKYVMYNKVLYSEPDMKIAYPELFSLRSDDGYVKIRFGNFHMMFGFAGILNVAKADTVSMDIYETETPNEVAIRFDIYKAKIKNTISVYIRQVMIS